MTNPNDFQMALPLGYALQHLAEIDSTNSEAQRWLAAGREPMALFVADIQTAGRGRRGRDWASPVGNLYASLLIPAPDTPQAAGRYGFIISFAIHHALADLLPAQTVTVKWPNDVLVNGAKVSGVLLELADGAAGQGLIIGFGINLVSAPADTPYKAASLEEMGVQVAPLALAAAIVKAFWRYEEMALPDLLAAWKDRAQGIGGPITVNLPTESIQGIFRGLADDGALQLELPDGTIRPIHNGDVFFR